MANEGEKNGHTEHCGCPDFYEPARKRYTSTPLRGSGHGFRLLWDTELTPPVSLSQVNGHSSGVLSEDVRSLNRAGTGGYSDRGAAKHKYPRPVVVATETKRSPRSDRAGIEYLDPPGGG